LARAQRSGAPLALVQLNIDGPRPPDEQLMGEVAARLRGCVRLTDTVARMGNDKFVVLLEGLKERGDAFRVAQKMLQAVRQPIGGGARVIQLATSVTAPSSSGTAIQTGPSHSGTPRKRKGAPSSRPDTDSLKYVSNVNVGLKSLRPPSRKSTAARITTQTMTNRPSR